MRQSLGHQTTQDKKAAEPSKKSLFSSIIFICDQGRCCKMKALLEGRAKSQEHWTGSCTQTAEPGHMQDPPVPRQGLQFVPTLIQEDNSCTGAQSPWAEGPGARRPATALMGSASCRAGTGARSLWQTRRLQRKGGRTLHSSGI